MSVPSGRTCAKPETALACFEGDKLSCSGGHIGAAELEANAGKVWPRHTAACSAGKNQAGWQESGQ